MKKLSFPALAVILTVCVLMQRPQLASALTCPTEVCQTWINLCNEACPGPYTVTKQGTCLDDGQTENYDVVRCACVTRSCWSLQ
jgi:hypothetical protein